MNEIETAKQGKSKVYRRGTKNTGEPVWVGWPIHVCYSKLAGHDIYSGRIMRDSGDRRCYLRRLMMVMIVIIMIDDDLSSC